MPITKSYWRGSQAWLPKGLWDLAWDVGEQLGIMRKDPIDEWPKTRKEEGQRLEKEGVEGGRNQGDMRKQV